MGKRKRNGRGNRRKASGNRGDVSVHASREGEAVPGVEAVAVGGVNHGMSDAFFTIFGMKRVK